MVSLLLLAAQPDPTPTTPDTWFWYSLSSLLAIALIWVLQRYVNKTETLIKELKDVVQGLLINDKVQDVNIHNHNERLNGIEDRINVVKYPRELR